MNTISSDNQKGGITAQNVTISSNPAIEEPRKLHWLESVGWKITIITALIGTTIAILSYLGEQKMNKDGISVMSYNQSGGITAGVVNMAPAARRLDDDLKIQLINAIPEGKEVDLVSVMGDPEAYAFALQIKNFLLSKNRKVYGTRHVDGVAQAMFTSPPMGQSIAKNGEVYKVVIGHNQ